MVVAFSEFLSSAVRREQAGDRERLATLRAIADTSIELMAMDDIGALLNKTAERARALVPSRRAELLLSGAAQPMRAVSPPDQDESPKDGALVAPLIRHSGDQFGRLRLAGRTNAAYTAEDEAILRQLASLASVCIEKVELLEHSRAAVAAARQAQAEVETVLSQHLRLALCAR